MRSMNKLICWPIACFFIMVAAPEFIFAQNKSSAEKLSVTEIEQCKKEIGRLISFFEFSINIVGSDSTTTQEKESVISTSYLKIFKNADVQIEDDLDQNRSVSMYKNVQAYLQDVNYFFKKVQFVLNIDNIDFKQESGSRPYFMVVLSRRLKGITQDGDSVENTQKRYVEINLEGKNRDLKIVSIYSTKLNAKDELISWWRTLPAEWKTVLMKEAGINDSSQYEQLVKIKNLVSLNLANNKQIDDFTPLNELTKLRQVNLSATAISNLTSLRNLSELESLILNDTKIVRIEGLTYLRKLNAIYINNTIISDLGFLNYFPGLKKLYCSGTLISDLSPVASLKQLQELDCSNTGVVNLTPLAALTNLKMLDISDTRIENIEKIEGLSNLERLYLSNTLINNILPLQQLKNLVSVSFNNTWVSSLNPLAGISTLETIYCDNTSIKQEAALQFMRIHKGTLVIYESGGLEKWWNSLVPVWKQVFKRYVQINDVPTKEQLASIADIDSLDISGNKKITDLEPLRVLSNLKVLLANNTNLTNLNALSELSSLRILEISGTKIQGTEVLEKLSKLERINCDNTPLDSLALSRFIENNRNCLVIHRSSELHKWWENIDDNWKTIFHGDTHLDYSPDDIQLHRLVRADSITIIGKQVKDIEPLRAFLFLRFLKISNINMSILPDLSTFRHLEVFDCSDNPISDIAPVANLVRLKNLDFSNTAVKSLKPLQTIIQLEVLKCSGTKIENVEPLESLLQLGYIDISNTRVRNVSFLEKNEKLKTLLCYNTAISKRKADKFKTDVPSCKVIYF
jgi:Leucine-rich repeat (LRR) protein